MYLYYYTIICIYTFCFIIPYKDLALQIKPYGKRTLGSPGVICIVCFCFFLSLSNN